MKAKNSPRRPKRRHARSGDDVPCNAHARTPPASTSPLASLSTSIASLISVAFLASAAAADVIRDGSIGDAGPGSVATTTGPGGGTDFLIGEADGRRSGNHLFHSFDRFDLTSSERAVYQGSASIRNLITRVTGAASSIDGVIRSEIPGANLFFINPAGVVFGENASVDVTGAFYVSTADRLLFENGAQLESGLSIEPLLSVENVAGFGFLEAPAPISIRGSQIEVGVGQSLGLVGGDLEILGGRGDDAPALFSARSGRIDLASLASGGEVYLDGVPAVDGSQLRVEGVTRRGNIRIADNVIVTTSGLRKNPFSGAVFVAQADGSGPVNVYGNDLVIEDADIRTLTVTHEDAGDVNIDLSGDLIARSVPGGEQSGILAGTGLFIQPPLGLVTSIVGQQFLGINNVTLFGCGPPICGVRYDASGRAGDVNIKAANVILEGGARITARSESFGDAGRITLRVEDTIRLSGIDDNGNRSGLASTTDGEGNPGEIRILSPGARLVMQDQAAIVIQNGELSRAEDEGGLPGLIEIDVDRIEMSGDSRIDSSTRGAGPGGNLLIKARDSIRMRGRTGDESFTGITALSQPDSTGPAGTIRIETARLLLDDGAEISAKPASDQAFGDSGSLEFDVSDQIRLRDSAILTDSATPAGGNITAFFGRLLSLKNSEISATVSSGAENGGNVTLTSNKGSALLLSNSEITAQADAGFGGNILIETSALLSDAASLISASSNSGIDGIVEIFAPDGQLIDLSQGIETPGVDATELLNEPCAARRPSNSNSLVVATQEGMPLSVEAVLPAFLPPSVYAELGVEVVDPEVRAAASEERMTLASVTNRLGGRSGECLD